MKQQEFCRALQQAAQPVPGAFHRRIEGFLAERVTHEEMQPVQRTVRASCRVLVIALVVLLSMGTVALAATHWGIFNALGFILGGQPLSDSMQMEKILHREVIDNTEVNVLEAGYDGRILLLQYTCQNPEGAKPYEEWWTDRFWVNGKSISMPADSGSDAAETDTPGKVIRTDYIRLVNENIQLSGLVTIGLPLGRKPDSEYFKFLYDSETDSYAQPDSGLVLFTFDTGEVLSRVETIHPNAETVTDLVTAEATEVSFTPLMTYITLGLEGTPAALEAYKVQHGEGYYDANGQLIWEFTSMDVQTEYLHSLTLVDEAGTVLFPEHYGGNGMGDAWAEYLFPHIAEDAMPKHLYLAPVENGAVNMAEAIFIK